MAKITRVISSRNYLYAKTTHDYFIRRKYLISLLLIHYKQKQPAN